MNFPNLPPLIAIDTECTGLSWITDKLFSFAIARPNEPPLYYDIRETPKAIAWLNDQLIHVSDLIGHNIKYDLHMLREAGVIVPWGIAHCTMVREALIDEHMYEYDLDSVATYRHVGRKDDPWAELAGHFGGAATKKEQIGNLARAPTGIASKYAGQDADLALKIYLAQEPELIKQDLLRVYNVERQLLPVLVEMERGGVRVDVARAERAVDELTGIIDESKKKLNTVAGFEVNPNPSGSIHKLFEPKLVDGNWVAIDGTTLSVTPAGKPSFGKEALSRMSHPAAALILQTRELLKTRDTFLSGHVLGNLHGEYVHPNFNQTRSEGELGSISGRLSCNAPALQQIPKRNSKVAEIVRACFLPDAGQEWCCHDWAQMDFRMAAHYINEPGIIAKYAEDPDTDFHQMVADLTGLPRKRTSTIKVSAKEINLGLAFGMKPGRMAKEAGLPYTEESFIDRTSGEVRKYLKAGPEAEKLFEQYHRAVPGVKSFLDRAIAVAKDRGYIRTILGRRSRFPDGLQTHKAGALIFQGSAADCLKVKLIEVHKFLRNSGGRLMVNVHDEFDTSLPLGSSLRSGITSIVETFDKEVSGFSFRVPIRSDSGTGINWWEASKE